jgi:hypothetical protein
MVKNVFDQQVLRSFLKKEKLATLEELKQALGGSGTMTVFRKLKALGYQTSYSHRGQYYTLTDIPRFDEQGLWCWRAVWFSRYGNSLATTRRFVEGSDAGLSASELESLLHIEVKQPLLQLYRQRRIEREKIGGAYVYFSRGLDAQRRQRLCREDRQAAWEMVESPVAAGVPPELKAAIILLFSLLDEQQRRLYAGLEAHKLGHGGDRQIAEFLGLDMHTVARGRRELFGEQVQRQRVRKRGGGRKPTEKKRPK